MHNLMIDETSCLKPGMELILTRQIGLLGTALLAEAEEQTLRERFSEAMIEEAKAFRKFADTRREAELIRQYGKTEIYPLGKGGILTGLWEIADRAGLGLTADLRKMTIRQETVEICEVLDVNPYLLESSGALLAGVENGYAVCEELCLAGITAKVIGRVNDGTERVIYNQGRKRFVDKPVKDEIYRFLPEWR